MRRIDDDADDNACLLQWLAVLTMPSCDHRKAQFSYRDRSVSDAMTSPLSFIYVCTVAPR